MSSKVLPLSSSPSRRFTKSKSTITRERSQAHLRVELKDRLKKQGILNAGSIRFPSSDRPPCKWVKVHAKPGKVDKETAKSLVGELRKTWGMPAPNVLISVTGGALYNWNMEPKLERAFKRGLLKAVRTTGAWVVTGGTNCGCMKLVGRTLKEEEGSVCIGIPPWECVEKHEKLEKQKHFCIYKYAAEAEKPHRQLDTNHSHFVLVEAERSDGDKGNSAWGTEIEMRSAIEEELCTEESRSYDTSPMVVLVLGGGLGTLKTVRASLTADEHSVLNGQRASPVVLVTESGGAARAIYRCCLKSPPDSPEEAAKDLLHNGGKSAESQQPDAIKLLYEIRDLSKVPLKSANEDLPLSAFSLDGEDSMYDVLLKAVLDDCQTSTQAIQLAVKWGDAKITREQLEESMEESKNGLKDELEEALLMGDCELVKVLLDFKADVSKVSLDSLVGRGNEDDPSFEDRCANLDRLDEYSRITSLHEKEENENFDKSVKEWLTDDLVTTGCQIGFAYLSQFLGDHFGYAKTHLKCRVEHNRGRLVWNEGKQVAWTLHPVWSDLFLWAVLLSQQELAKLLWARCDDPLRLALIASLLCKQLMEKRDGIEKEELGAQAAEYERWAEELLEEAPEEDAPLLLLAIPVLEPSKDGKRARRPSRDYAGPAAGRVSRLLAGGENSKAKDNPLWPSSPIELAHNEGNLELSCKKFLAHRFSKELCNSIYNGCVYQLVEEEELAKSSSWSVTRLAHLDEEVDEVDPDYMNSIVEQDSIKTPLKTDIFKEREIPWPLSAFLGPKFFMPTEANMLQSALHLVHTPRFKLIFHNTMGGGYLLLLTVFLCGWWPWGPHSHTPGYYHSWQWQQGLLPAEPPAEEILLWVWTLGRLWQEFAQMKKQGADEYEKTKDLKDLFDYFTDLKQWCDLLTYLAVLGIAAARCAVWWETDGDYLKMDGDYTRVQLVASCTYAVVAVVTFVRFTDVLKISQVGLLYVMLTRMFVDVGQWLTLSLFGTLGTSVALTVLMPNDITGGDRPFLRPFWVMVGDFNRDAMQEYFPSSGIESNVGVLTSILVFLYVFVMTVVLVNLLIAQMSSTYEKLKDEKYEIWQAGRVTLIVEYKDLFDAVPAPFNLIEAVCYSLPVNILRMLFPKSDPKDGGGNGVEKEIPRPGRKLRLQMPQMAARHAYKIACEARKSYLAIEHRDTQCSQESRVLQVKAAQQDMGAQLEAVSANVEALRIHQSEMHMKLQDLSKLEAILTKLDNAADKLTIEASNATTRAARPSPARAPPKTPSGQRQLPPLPQFASQKQLGDSVPGTLAADGEGETILRGTAAFLAGLRGDGTMPDEVRPPPGRPPPAVPKQHQPTTPVGKPPVKLQPAAAGAALRNPTPPLAQTFDDDGNAVVGLPPGKMAVPVVLPQGYVEGNPMMVQLKDGRRIECRVPRGVKPGDSFNVVVDKAQPR